MRIEKVDWTDADAVRRLVAVTNAARRVDSPWLHPLTEHECVGDLSRGWDGEPKTAFVATVGGVDVGAGGYEASTYDNQHLAWLEVEIVPELRRRGHGSALLEHMVGRARSEGRTTVGIADWEGPGPVAFATGHGFEQKSVEVHRRQHLDGFSAPPLPTAPDYELVRWPSETPAADLAALAALTEAIRLVARHRPSGDLAGQTVVAVDGERPELAEQHDTSVVAAHRGHRLGLLLKLEMLRWLAEVEPQVRELDTWNAESNDHMIGVNELLGYRVLGRVLDYQRRI